MLPELSLQNFDFELPVDRIAEFPVEPRDHSRLLVYKSGEISEDHFFHIPQYLPAKSLLIYNDTRVIPARLLLQRASGARIEVLLLEPVGKESQKAMLDSPLSDWKCMIGGLKKWKNGEVLVLQMADVQLEVLLLDRQEQKIRLQWNSDHHLSEILEMAGKLPLPPYLHRDTEEKDKESYQTVYARNDGAIAAPTAGLHFTGDVMQQLKKEGHKLDFVTLHVGAGTFLPVKTDNPKEHVMHHETMVISKDLIRRLYEHEGPLIPVGTTSMRTLESLYQWGCKLSVHVDSDFFIGKLEAYGLPQLSGKESLKNVLDRMEKENQSELKGGTEIMIMPGYRFGLCDGLITNFHLPATTLILLVAAFVGEDWRKIYDYALTNKFRFLSFGDSSLLLPTR